MRWSPPEQKAQPPSRADGPVVGDVGEGEPLDGTPPLGVEDLRDHGPHCGRRLRSAPLPARARGRTGPGFSYFLLAPVDPGCHKSLTGSKSPSARMWPAADREESPV